MNYALCALCGNCKCQLLTITFKLNTLCAHRVYYVTSPHLLLTFRIKHLLIFGVAIIELIQNAFIAAMNAISSFLSKLFALHITDSESM